MQLLSTGLRRMGTVCRRLFLPQRFQDTGWRQRQLMQAYAYGMIHRIGDRGEGGMTDVSPTPRTPYG